MVSETETCGLGFPGQLWTTTPSASFGGVGGYSCEADWDRLVMDAKTPGADRHVRDWIASFQERFGMDTKGWPTYSCKAVNSSQGTPEIMKGDRCAAVPGGLGSNDLRDRGSKDNW